MVISADWVADLGIGASMVRVPSGDREEETRVGSIPGGSWTCREQGQELHTGLSLHPPPAPTPRSGTRTHEYFRVKHREM